MPQQKIHRRNFLRNASAALAFTALKPGSFEFLSAAAPRRVALIGTGWYGKSDLFRLIQVAPVEVVGLCDVDKNQLDHAAAMVSQRQTSKKRPPIYTDHAKMLAEQSPEITLI